MDLANSSSGQLPNDLCLPIHDFKSSCNSLGYFQHLMRCVMCLEYMNVLFEGMYVLILWITKGLQ